MEDVNLMDIWMQVKELHNTIALLKQSYQICERKFYKTDKIKYVCEMNNLKKNMVVCEKQIIELEATEDRLISYLAEENRFDINEAKRRKLEDDFIKDLDFL